MGAKFGQVALRSLEIRLKVRGQPFCQTVQVLKRIVQGFGQVGGGLPAFQAGQGVVARDPVMKPRFVAERSA